MTGRKKRKKGRTKLTDSDIRREILEKQKYRCAACGCKIGTTDSKIGYEDDHIIPYSYLDDSPKENWQFLCCICNRIGSDFVFHTSDIEIAKFKKNQWILRKRLGDV